MKKIDKLIFTRYCVPKDDDNVQNKKVDGLSLELCLCRECLQVHLIDDRIVNKIVYLKHLFFYFYCHKNNITIIYIIKFSSSWLHYQWKR